LGASAHWRKKTQTLFNGSWHQCGISPEPGVSFGVIVQAEHGIANQVRRCFVPGHQEKHARIDNLIFPERFSIDLRREPPTDQIILWFPSPVGVTADSSLLSNSLSNTSGYRTPLGYTTVYHNRDRVRSKASAE